MKQILVIGLAILLAGCLGSEDGSSDPGQTQMATAPAGFLSGVAYDPSEVDLDLLSQPQFEVVQEQEWVTMSDGERMDNHVFRPDAEGTFPVFINFSPYWGNTAELGGDNFAKYLVENFVPRGYVVVLSALRGTGHSEGCFEIASDREVQDLYEVIDHYASVPYSNGNVASGGKSYDSTTQNGLIAKMPHPALRGLFHVSGITDMYRYNLKDGVPSINGLAFTPRYYATQTFDELLFGNPLDLSPNLLLRTVDDVACPEAAEHLAHGEAAAVTGVKTEYWQEREWTEFIGDSDWNGSIFFVHGFQDWNVKPDNILPWLQNLPEEIHVLSWLHQDTYNGGHVYPMRTDWNLTMLRWMDETLKGIDAGIGLDDRHELQGTDGNWRLTPAYLDEPVEMAIGSDGRVDTDATRLTGHVYVSGTVTPMTPDGVFTATLYSNNNGTRAWAGEAVARLTLEDSLYAPAPVVVGQPMDVDVDFYALDAVALDGFEVVFGEAPRHSVSLGVADGIAPIGATLYGAMMSYGDMTLHAVALDEQDLLPQPAGMPCVAC